MTRGASAASGDALDVFGDVTGPCRDLASRCPGLAAAFVTIGTPNVRRRPGGFAGLFRIIVEQQVSVPSAQAILSRITAAMDMDDPYAAQRLGVDGLRGLGLSTPKARYVIGLADAVVAGAIDFAAIARLSDEAAAEQLLAIRGIGPWSAGIYLLFCEGRADIWPPRDVALRAAYAVALANVSGNATTVTQAMIDERAADWRPYRGLAAHILWTFYATVRGRTPI